MSEMNTDNQALKLSYIARCLITDLQPLYAEECIGSKLNEERALQLILDAFEQASSVLTCPEVICPYCDQRVPDYMDHAMHNCTVIDNAVKQLVND